jgi:putative transposase
MPAIINFILTDSDYESLLVFIKKSKAPVQEIKRAETLLLLHNQIPPVEICRMLGVASTTSRRLRQTYLKEGLKRTLYDAYRSGKPPKFSPSDRAKITALACSEAPEGYGKWSLSLLADKLVELKYVESISKAQVGRILKKTK